MNNLLIEPAKKTPLIEFFASGKLKLAGSAYPENADEFFNPIIDWVARLNAEVVEFDMNVEYINTSAAKKLIELLQKLSTNRNIVTRKVNWHYQKWDEDSLETGQILSDSLPSIAFDFVEYDREEG